MTFTMPMDSLRGISSRHIQSEGIFRQCIGIMRDSNFNVDFSKGAVASAVFLNTEMQQTVDGVIGVDLSFVQKFTG
jgi:coenzyme F420-reducing hydrogenase beta subunit